MQLLNHMDDLNGMRTMAAPTENAEALLEELRSASELMRSLAKAETVLSAPDRQKAGALAEQGVEVRQGSIDTEEFFARRANH